MDSGDDVQIKVGDVFITFGVPNRVYALKSQKNLDGKVEQFVFFKSCFPDSRGGEITQAIPVVNFGRVRHRSLLTKSEIRDMLADLARKVEFGEEVIDLEEATEMIRSNNSQVRVKLVKRLWQEKKIRGGAFPYSKRAFLSRAFENVRDEVAVVLQVTPAEAEKKLESCLNH